MSTREAHILDILKTRAAGSLRSVRISLTEVHDLMLSRFREEVTAGEIRQSVSWLVKGHRLTWAKIDAGTLYYIA